MSPRREVALWVAQRASAAVLALCVAVHLVTIIYAVRAGLGAAEILGRTRGSLGWGAFYSLFVIAAAVHGPIGLRTVAAEWLGLRGAVVDCALVVAAVALALGGMRAVLGVVGA